MDSDWLPSPLGDGLMSRRSAQHTPSSSIFGSNDTLSPQTGRFASTSQLDGDETLFVKPGDKSMLCEKDFLQTSSFDSSDDDAPHPLKSASTFFERVAGNHGGSENELSETGELDASEEIKSLFQFVGCYKPREVEIGTILRPFIPDYIPAVGAVDEFIKVPRPDGLPDYLGLKVLDESGSIQSDPSVVTLQLRASAMQSSHHPVEVATIEDPEKNPRNIDAWIESMKDLHRSKPPSSVTYSKPMPDIEKLMKEWPIEVEKALAEMELPNTHEDVDLSTFVDICCSFIGIPVYKSRVESLHCMFALFLELKKHSCLSSIRMEDSPARKASITCLSSISMEDSPLRKV